MDLAKYLQRIGLYNSSIEPNLSNLKLLQYKHLLNVPFENLDIHWNHQITLNIQNFYNKIVENKRGGFCYELNGLFNKLLNKIGYKTKIISARVNSGKGSLGKEYDHLAILTEINGEEYLTDVGFGDFIVEPLKFTLDLEQKDSDRIYRIKKFDDEYFEVENKDENNWKSEYIFKNKARDLKEFEGMCSFHQSSESHFSKGRVCSLLTENGRKTLTDKKFIQKTNDKKVELKVKTEEEFATILEREFGIRK